MNSLSAFAIYHSSQGNQGKLGQASKQQLENVFGSSRDDEAAQQMLERGTLLGKTEMQGSGMDKLRRVKTLTLPIEASLTHRPRIGMVKCMIPEDHILACLVYDKLVVLLHQTVAIIVISHCSISKSPTRIYLSDTLSRVTFVVALNNIDPFSMPARVPSVRESVPPQSSRANSPPAEEELEEVPLYVLIMFEFIMVLLQTPFFDLVDELQQHVVWFIDSFVHFPHCRRVLMFKTLLNLR